MSVARRLVGAVLVSGVVVASPAKAQNGFSFTTAETSPVRYTLATAEPQTACAALRELAAPNVTILSATAITGSESMPAHCRVAGIIAPEIRFEVNLPANWNRRFYMIGNGGLAGESPDAPPRAAAREAALRNGFAMATTNTGHDAVAEPLATFALNNTQKEIDYAFRAVHLTAVTAKRIVGRYYGRPPAFSYWDGCSTGGRQGLMEAQRFPGDFNGYLVGAPVLNIVETLLMSLWTPRVLDETPIPVDKVKVIADALYAKCDKVDGAADGIIEDPRRCAFDPPKDLPICAAGQEGGVCVTAAQAGALAKLYNGRLKDGKAVAFGIPPGAEQIGNPPFGPPQPASGWDRWIIAAPNAQPIHLAYSDSFMKFMAFPKDDPSFDWRKFDFDKDPDRIVDIRLLLNATDPDLSGMKSRGAKLLMYHGWADVAVPPYPAIEYYERVTAKFGKDTPSFARLFMVPGMFHCRGGVGTDRIDGMTALINWVENGAAPERLNSARLEGDKVTRTRALCPYPQVSRHDGVGRVEDAASFSCQAPN